VAEGDDAAVCKTERDKSREPGRECTADEGIEGAVAKSVSAMTALASLGREMWLERRSLGDSCLEKLLKDEASVTARLPRLSGRTWVSEVGDEAPTLCLRREYRPLMRPLTKSFGPGTRGLVERLGSKSLKEVRVTEREAVV
jgi:hypothetical protein